jgi:hypothetical protein
MTAPRKLLLLDPTQKLLKDFQTKTEQVIDESNALLESVPEVPSNTITEKHMEGAKEILDCMIVIQGQLKELEKTYKHMKNYVQTVCIDAKCSSIESKTAIGILSRRAQFNQRMFRETHPDLYQLYILQTDPFLTVKQRK